ncbi:MAG: UbiX family flavin prenyltransferase [Candidatus Methanofastidiosia archaeon]
MKIVLGITGASGVIYGVRLLEELRENEVHLIISEAGKLILKNETNYDLSKLENSCKSYKNNDLEAPPASGSFLFDAFVVCPCSANTLSKIANGISDNLITRIASVALKEKRELVLVLRETPLSQVHLENMLKLSKLGVCILPAMPGFYHSPKTLDDLVDFVVGKILDFLGIENEKFRRWGR